MPIPPAGRELSMVTGKKTTVMVASQNGTKLGGSSMTLDTTGVVMALSTVMMATVNLTNQCRIVRAMPLSLQLSRTIVMIIPALVSKGMIVLHMLDLRSGLSIAISMVFSNGRSRSKTREFILQRYSTITTMTSHGKSMTRNGSTQRPRVSPHMFPRCGTRIVLMKKPVKSFSQKM
jgi:hypothetical protein